MQPGNVLFLMSDEHNPKVLGCAGHPLIRTPNLDALARRGTRFTSAYTNSPICVPARAALATGRYVHEIRYWDNATPYDGGVPSWGHRLQAHGRRCVSVGKLHYRSVEDACGFDEELEPMHVVDGIGDLTGLIRSDIPVRMRSRRYVEEAGSGDSPYLRYDRAITEAAVRWLREEASREQDTPWVLFVSWVCPHFPLVAPPEFFALYPPEAVPWPAQNQPGVPPPHPGVAEYWRLNNYDAPFTEAQTRRALAAYFGMVSFMDANVGAVLRALEEAGLTDTTRVIYTSDHGDNLGRNGMFGKSTMYEDSAGIPLLLAGADVPAGRLCDTPVSLVDVYPTVLEWAGVPAREEDAALPGRSLHAIANGAQPERTVLSEYHATCSTGGIFMVRREHYKYVHYAGYPPALYDLRADPDELEDLAERGGYRGIAADCEAELRTLLDPAQVDALAKADQGRRIAAHGGRERILAGGGFGYTPAPGQAPDKR